MIVKILIPVMGCLLLVFGYLIVKRKKYNLVNGFQDTPYGRRMAERLGEIELCAGVLFLATGCVLFFVKNHIAVWVTLAVLVVGLIASLFAAYGKG